VTIERPHSTEIEALALARRSGWPEDLRVMLTRYPREQWDAHPNLGAMARFWLSRHAMFRELSAAIEGITMNFRAGQLPPAEFARQFVPRLQFMLDQLNVHHQIEDLHYFPIFQAADARLARGFDVRWRAIITTSMATWLARQKLRMRCCRHCKGMPIDCAVAATITQMRAECS